MIPEKENKIPVTIITGFLGAGKTTFINNLLKKYPDIQFALVENEFGDVAIDTQLIKGVDASRMFELKQGCICCTITDEYELVLQELAERFPNVEHLLIETTGIADPAPVVRPFFSDENLKKLYGYDGTVCLVDALNFDTQPEREISLKQIAVADVLLVNKSENLKTEQKETFKNQLQQINPFSSVQFAEYADTANIHLTSLHNHDTSRYRFTLNISPHSHIQTKILQFEKPLPIKLFTEWLSYTLDIYKNEIYRVKGILCLENEPYEYILQGVGGSFELEEGDNLISNQLSQIVFIGKAGMVNLNLSNIS